MTYNKITREQLVRQFGTNAVERLDAANCEPTSRLLPDNDDRTEWVASLFQGGIECGAIISAYYYTTPEDNQVIADHDGDGGAIEWTVDHYAIEVLS